MTMTTPPSLRETHFAAQASAERQAKIHLLQENLIETRLGVDAIEEPVLGYFIAMAITEMRRMTPADQETPSPQDGRKSSKCVSLANLPAKVA